MTMDHRGGTGTVLLASGNLHKLREFREATAGRGLTVLGADEVGGLPPVVEDGRTFAENAIKKATEVARRFDLPVIADDSGLSVSALGGAPGVRSARYAGPAASDRENLEKLLAEMRGVEDRRACFVCVLAVATRTGLHGTLEGRVEGRIARIARGERGFGYDPVFIPEGFEQTFAELPAAAKHRISHRGRALQALVNGEKGLLEAIQQAGAGKA